MSKGTVNKVILIGNLGADPEVRYMPSGDAMATVNVATTEAWKDAQGVQQERTEWHRVVFFRKTAEIAGQYLKKGSKVYIDGSLRTRKWQDKTGQDRYTTEVVAQEMQMLDRMGGGGGGGSGSGDPGPWGEPVPQMPQSERYMPPPSAGPGPAPGAPRKEPAPGGASGLGDDFDDDIPFARPAALDGLVFPNDGAWFGNGAMFPYKRK